MWPWGHLGVGYLCYILVLHLRGKTEQPLIPLLALTFGTQFPDLVDKPLAWSFALLPSGRSLAHSLLTATVVILVVHRISTRIDHEESAIAFGIGYVSHSLSDLGPEVIVGLLRGDLAQLTWTTYLLWPVLPAPPYPHDNSFAEHFMAFTLDPYVVFQLGVAGIAFGIWVASSRSRISQLISSRSRRDVGNQKR